MPALFMALLAADVAAAYSCGTPLSTDQNLVKTQFATWKGRYLKTMGSNECCIRRPTNSDDCVSEGVGYGMLISAYLSDQATFQCLWSFAKSKFDANGLMNWQIDSSGNIAGSGAALDADEDMAMALLIGCESFSASNLCDDGHSLITRLMLYEVDSSTSTPKAGDGWGGCDVTNPSYFSPGYYTRFRNVTGDRRWTAATSQLYSIISKVNQHSSTGLLPDWTDCSGNLGASAVSSFCKDSGRDFWFDAVRSPWRLSLAAAWDCDAKAMSQVSKMLSFFERQGGASQVKTGYTLSGQALGGNDQGCFLSMASTLYVHSTDSDARSAFWTALTAADPSDYFCDALRMIALLFNTGLMTPTFHPPSPPSPPSPPTPPVRCNLESYCNLPLEPSELQPPGYYLHGDHAPRWPCPSPSLSP
uniref:Cellulase n=1 Tax=Haptolina brevifila TaxID=156173 RepID=A0A7S2IIJ5_9EUKA